jgi:IS605 OrfB family transposase
MSSSAEFSFPTGKRSSRSRWPATGAVLYRFVRDGESWRVLVSTEASPVEWTTDKRLGAIGIDINPDQLVVAEIDRSGNFVGGEQMPCVTYGKTPEQAEDIVGVAVKLAIAAAVRVCKPIVLERLEFAKKKAALEHEGSKRARLLSSFAYRRTIQYLKAAAFRAGVQVIEVNPAYTSTIGAVNYAARYGISIHQGAAVAIAPERFGSVGAFGRAGSAIACPRPRPGHLTPTREESEQA